MLFNINTNEMVFTSEDAIEAKFLAFLFENKVRFIVDSDFIRNGFHTTDERRIQIKIIKENN